MSTNKKEVLLLERIREGDEHAFEIAFLKYYSALTKHVWSYVRSEALAKEIVQEVFAKLWDSKSNLDPDGHLKGLLYEIARNKALDYIKHQKIVDQYIEKANRRRKAKKQPEVYDTAHDETLVNDVEDAIKCLSPKARQVFKLNRQEGLTYKEIACHLNISTKTVESHMRRVFKKLRKHLSKYSPVLLLVNRWVDF